MKPKKPLVSIILPVYNSILHLSTCLESLLSQTHKNIEIIAIDDFSKDGSYRLLNKYKKLDKRLSVSRNKKRYGLAVCFNRALKKAKGQFITFMDPRDVSDKLRIQKQIDFLLKNPKTVAVGAQCTYVDMKDKRLGRSKFPKKSAEIMPHILPGLSLQFETVMINTHLLPRDILKFKHNNYPFIYSDVFMRLFQYGEFANLAQNLHIKRVIMIQDMNSKIAKVKQFMSISKLFLRSIAVHDYTPPLQALFPRLAR